MSFTLRQTLIIDGVDFSDYIQQKVNVTEEPIYSDGAAVGETLADSVVRDRLGIRFRNSFSLKPLPQSKFFSLLKASAANSVTVTLTTSRSASPITIDAQITLSQYSYATTAGERVYSGANIIIEGNDAEL